MLPTCILSLREIEEEMGLDTTWIAPNPSYFLVGRNPKGTPIANVFFETTLADLNITPTDECVEVRFVNASGALELRANENVHLLAHMFDPGLHMKPAQYL